MKSLRWHITLLLATFVAMAGSAQLKWLELSHNFGTFDEDMGKVSCEFRFVNEGKADVMIETVRPTCGCTASDYTKHAIAPGDTAHIRLTYNPVGRPGKFSKTAIVLTNTEPKRVELVISGNVIGSANTIHRNYPISVGEMKFKTLIVPYGQIAKGNEEMLALKAYNQSRDTMELTFERVPKYITIKCIPAKVPPSGIATISVFFNSGKCDDWGTVKDSFDMTSRNLTTNAINSAKVDMIATITENLSLLGKIDLKKAPQAEISTDKLDFGTIVKGSSQNEERIFTIQNNGKNPLAIRKIYTVDEAISISPASATVKKGKSQKVKVRVNSSKLDGDMLNSKIMIITNDPANSLTSVRAVGELK